MTDDKILEGAAIAACVFAGACNQCSHLEICKNNRRFRPPVNAPCMIKKQELAKQLKKGDALKS